MRLAPGEFMRADVGGLTKVGRARVLRWNQVTSLNPDPVRYTVVAVATVIVGARWERTCERIDPRAGTDAILVAIQTRGIRVGAAGTQLWAWIARGARITGTADKVLQRQERMFHPRVSDLFEALGVIGTTAHTIKILGNNRVIGLG